jgi:hypothetical protein
MLHPDFPNTTPQKKLPKSNIALVWIIIIIIIIINLTHDDFHIQNCNGYDCWSSNASVAMNPNNNAP